MVTAGPRGCVPPAGAGAAAAAGVQGGAAAATGAAVRAAAGELAAEPRGCSSGLRRAECSALLRLVSARATGCSSVMRMPGGIRGHPSGLSQRMPLRQRRGGEGGRHASGVLCGAWPVRAAPGARSPAECTSSTCCRLTTFAGGRPSHSSTRLLEIHAHGLSGCLVERAGDGAVSSSDSNETDDCEDSSAVSSVRKVHVFSISHWMGTSSRSSGRPAP
jgi:hypothetical protein